MAITQQRMLSLIAAARDYQNATRRAVAYLQRGQKAIAEGRSSPEQEHAYLSIMLQEQSLLEDPMNSPSTILVEEQHFRTAASRNKSAAKRAKKKRLARGVKPREQNFGPDRMAELQLAPEISTAPWTLAKHSVQPGVRPQPRGITTDILAEMQRDFVEAGVALDERGVPVTPPADAPKGLYDPPDDTAPILTSEAIAKDGDG